MKGTKIFLIFEDIICLLSYYIIYFVWIIYRIGIGNNIYNLQMWIFSTIILIRTINYNITLFINYKYSLLYYLYVFNYYKYLNKFYIIIKN